MKGYTLVEAVVVMAIIIVITALGIYGIVAYRATVELNSVYTDLTTAIKTQRNKANNSVAYNPPGASRTFIAPDFYGLKFENNVYDFIYCNKLGLSNLIGCLKDETSNPSASSTEVTISSSCPGIGFEIINADSVLISQEAISATGIYQSSPSSSLCTITLTHTRTNFTKIITIDLAYALLSF